MTPAAVAAGAAVAVAVTIAIGSAGAASAPITLGSTTGTPSGNLCAATVRCTYYSTSSGTTPAVQVPSDGTITGFSLNSGSATGTVFLRVLRPAGTSFMGAGTSPAETLTTPGVNTFTGLSLPVKAGDVLGIDNDSSALLFDQTATTADTFEYQPALADNTTGAPTASKPGLKLLLSATEQPSSTTTTTPSTTPTTPSGPITTTNPSSVPTPTSNTKPSLSSVSQARKVWREGSKLASLAAAKRPPVGTTFTFTLNEAAKVTLTFQRKSSRQKPGKKPKFVTKVAGQLSFVGHAGVDKVSFQGALTSTKRLAPRKWTVVISASTSAGTTQVSRKFTIVH